MRAVFVFIAGTAMAAPAVRWGNIPLSFEPNRGQAPAEVRYLARGSSYTLYLACGETVLAPHAQSPLRTRLLGANLSVRITGEAPQVSTSNYFVGSDPRKWHTSVPNYGRVRYSGVYPGIDLLYYGKDGQLEYDWIVSPRADPARIRMIFENTDQLRIDQEGDLVIRAGNNEYRQKRPVMYQDIGGKRVEIAGSGLCTGRKAVSRLAVMTIGKNW